MKTFLDGRVSLWGGDCLEVVRGLADNSIDSVCTDPPYALVSISKRFGAAGAAPAGAEHAGGAYARASSGFMGKNWDTGETAFAVEFWAEVLRVLRPGGHVAAFGGTRSYHRLACAIEDAGFEVRDQLAWAYGTGFPKSHDIGKNIDKDAGHWRGRAGEVVERTVGQAAKGTEYVRTDKGSAITGAARQWEGWGTALKPAWEPICLARKPLSEKTVVANVLRWGTGAINVDGCRVGFGNENDPRVGTDYVLGEKEGINSRGHWNGASNEGLQLYKPGGRFPANLCHDGSDEVLELFPDSKAAKPGSVVMKASSKDGHGNASSAYGKESRPAGTVNISHGDSGSAARFFYSAKASKADRVLSKHPTVKPVKLMQWLVRLITPPGGTTLDPFAGTGTTGEAAWREGFSAVLIEREEEYQADIERRMLFAKARPKADSSTPRKPRKRDCDPGTLELPIPDALSLAPPVASYATPAQASE